MSPRRATWWYSTPTSKGSSITFPHSIIMAAVAAEVSDGNILTLLERFLTAGVMEDGVFKPTTIGTPQGGVISPLLANIVLDRLDWRLHAAGYRFVRYADDFVVLCLSASQAHEALELVRRRARKRTQAHVEPGENEDYDLREGV